MLQNVLEVHRSWRVMGQIGAPQLIGSSPSEQDSWTRCKELNEQAQPASRLGDYDRTDQAEGAPRINGHYVVFLDMEVGNEERESSQLHKSGFTLIIT